MALHQNLTLLVEYEMIHNKTIPVHIPFLRTTSVPARDLYLIILWAVQPTKSEIY